MTNPATFHRAGGSKVLRQGAMMLATGVLLISRAHAGCDPRTFGTSHVHIPSEFFAYHWSSNSIVGLWHAEYTSPADPTFDYQSFDVWHADRTEFESADIPPLVGALCVGVWEQHGLTVHLNHFGWTWDSSGLVPTGSFNLIETLKVHPDGTAYDGTFDFKPYDVNGVFEPDQEVQGTVTAMRITLRTHGAD